jgi:hypothetical protein
MSHDTPENTPSNADETVNDEATLAAPEYTATTLTERERLEATLARIRRDAAELPPVKPAFIAAAFAVAVTFSILLVGMIWGVLSGNGSGSQTRAGGGFSQVISFLFFLMPIVLTLRYGITRLRARRKLKQYLRAERSTLAKLGKVEE